MANQSVAYDLDMYKPEPAKIKEVKTVKKPSQQPKKKQNGSLKLLCLVAVLAAAFMVYSRVSLNEVTGRLNAARGELITVTTEQNRLDRLVDIKMSNSNIEEYATTRLGMIRPDATQIHYVSLSDQNKIEIKEPSFSLPNVITAAIDKIRSYFD